MADASEHVIDDRACEEELFSIDAELEAVLLESIAHGRAGNTISADDLLAEMRSRESGSGPTI